MADDHHPHDEHVIDTSNTNPNSIPNTNSNIIPDSVQETTEINPIDFDEEEEPILFGQDVIQEADDLTQRSLIMRVFWDNPRPRLAIQRTLNIMWNCDGKLRVYDADFGLYHIMLPSADKKQSIFRDCPWNMRGSLFNIIEYEIPSPELFKRLRLMNIWVKLSGIPLSCLTIEFAKIMLGSIGAVSDVGFFEISAGSMFLKGLVVIDVTGSFRGRSNNGCISSKEDTCSKKRALAKDKAKAEDVFPSKIQKRRIQANTGIVIKEPIVANNEAEDSDSEDSISSFSTSIPAIAPFNSLLNGESSHANDENKINEFGTFLIEEEEDEDIIPGSLPE
ncbi:hypothetical protein LINGRAHAP2_LOCUS36579 [Linum grandiflorum]